MSHRLYDIDYSYYPVLILLVNPRKKFKCESNVKCKGYTFERSGMTCVLHHSVLYENIQRKRGRKIGIKRKYFSIDEDCQEARRMKRCKKEPNCEHVDCHRFAKTEFGCNAGKCKCIGRVTIKE